MNDNSKYEKIINLPRHVSKFHTQMSLEKRSAQFAPFSALTGYEDEVKETARLTDKRIEIDEGLRALLNNKLNIIQDNIKDKPLVSITYFIPDKRKSGGEYITLNGNIKKLDNVEHFIILTDGTKISMYDVIDLNSEILKNQEIE